MLHSLLSLFAAQTRLSIVPRRATELLIYRLDYVVSEGALPDSVLTDSLRLAKRAEAGGFSIYAF